MLSVITKVYPYLLARVPVVWVSSNFFWASLICSKSSDRSLISSIPYSLHLIILAKGLCFPQTWRTCLSVSPYACRWEGVRSRLSMLWGLPALKHACFLQDMCVMLLSFITHFLPLWLVGIKVLFWLLLRKRRFLEDVNKIYQSPSSLLVLLAHPACSQEGNVTKYFP